MTSMMSTMVYMTSVMSVMPMVSVMSWAEVWAYKSTCSGDMAGELLLGTGPHRVEGWFQSKAQVSLDCVQAGAGGYARLSPSFPPTDADPSSWTPIYQHGHQPIIMVTNL